MDEHMPTDERRRAVEGLDKYMVGPVVEPFEAGESALGGLDTEGDGRGWLGAQIRAAVDRAFAAGVASASAGGGRAAVEAGEEYRQMRHSAFWLVAASLGEPPVDRIACRSGDPSDRLPAGSYERAPEHRRNLVAHEPGREERIERRLSSMGIGRLLRPRRREPTDGAGWLATSARKAVDSAYAAGIRVVTARNHKDAAAAVDRYEAACGAANMVESLASLPSEIDATPAPEAAATSAS